MMKENYFSNFLKVLGLTLPLILLSQFSVGQTDITWTGVISNDANNPANWDPQLIPDGKIIHIDTASKYTNLPVWDVLNNTSVTQIRQTDLSELTINIVYADSLLDVGGSDNTYHAGILNIGGEGWISFRKNLYLADATDTLNVTGGVLETRSALLMGNANVASTGGHVTISGTGRIHCWYAPFRFTYPDTTMSNIVITDDGSMTVVGDFSTIADSLKNTGQIRSTVDYEIIIEYNSTDNLTYITSRSTNIFLTEQTGIKYATLNQEAEPTNLVVNAASEKMTSIEWKYSSTSGSGYQSFYPALTNDTVSPVFSNQGVYYLICEGTYSGGTLTTDELKYIVSSDKVHVTPSGNQNLKIGQAPYQLTVVEDADAASRQWLYTTTPGEGYMAFDPAVTDTFCFPMNDKTGNYFVVCRSVIGGVDHQSTEVQITVVDSANFGNIRWNGNISEEGANIRNWTPNAYLYHNNIVLDTSEYNIDPVINTVGNDYIGSLDLPAGAIFTIDKPENDTMFRTGTDYIAGTLHIKNGFYHVKSYQFFKDTTSVLDIEGGGYIQSAYDLLIGGKYGEAGGKVNVHGTGLLYANGIGRFSTVDTTTSIVTVWDEGKIVLEGDQSANALKWMAKKQLATIPGWDLELGAIINGVTKDTLQTIITAHDTNAITVSPKTVQLLAIDEVASTLTASKTDVFDSLIWKYSTSVGGELIVFEPAINDTFAAPSFSTPGIYYVVCIGFNDTLTKKSNSVQLIIPDVAITPSEKQVMKVSLPTIELEVTESPVADSRVWKTASVSGGPYDAESPELIELVYTPNFSTTGSMYVVCVSNYDGKEITSNEVEVKVVDVEVTPSSTQNLTVNTDGTTISVTETGTVDSREWLVSTTSGSGYESFDPAETGAKFTPNFANTGTYYIVCATVFSGVTIMSEEIRINVDPVHSGINTVDDYALAISPNPTTGVFVINEENLANYRVDIYDTQGRLVLSEEFDGTISAQELVLENKGIYIVNLVAPEFTKTTKLIVE